MRQGRDYSKLTEDMTGVITSDYRQQQIRRAVSLFATGDITETHLEYLVSLRTVTSYLYYFKAEAYRLRGSPLRAPSQLYQSMEIRRLRFGVSINDLERLDGLITLERVSYFNQQVDRLYGISRSPDYDQLASALSLFEGNSAPLSKIRSSATSSPTITSSPRVRFHDLQRIDPDQGDFSGQSVAKDSVESILREFSMKLKILGVSSPEDQWIIAM